uniref:Uncharacterized protein n=1 Tax=Romanomermis culicivorax TaxID=13658 RepID=A0A915JUB9_ROMCU
MIEIENQEVCQSHKTIPIPVFCIPVSIAIALIFDNGCFINRELTAPNMKPKSGSSMPANRTRQVIKRNM